MDFTGLLSVLIAVSASVERIAEVIKPLYLKTKNKLLKTDLTECTKVEKTIMSIVLGIFICLITNVGVDIPQVNETTVIQQILAGLISSFGSNILHTALSILTSIKNNSEARLAKK